MCGLLAAADDVLSRKLGFQIAGMGSSCSGPAHRAVRDVARPVLHPEPPSRVDMPWFATLVAVNLQTSFMSPPFGATLFYMKGTVPPDCSMTDVYRGMYPVLILQIIGPFSCVFSFPVCRSGCPGSPACSTEPMTVRVAPA